VSHISRRTVLSGHRERPYLWVMSMKERSGEETGIYTYNHKGLVLETVSIPEATVLA
jgi:hypothetical protein